MLICIVGGSFRFGYTRFGTFEFLFEKCDLVLKSSQFRIVSTLLFL